MISEGQRTLLRQIPAIHELLQNEALTIYLENGMNQDLLTEICQECTNQIRQQILAEHVDTASNPTSLIIECVRAKVDLLLHSPLKPLINGTGVILHTNLGRAKLSVAAQEELRKVASYYSNLEFELVEGKRGSRHAIVEDLICQLTGAEASLVCNNNASAVFLVLRELAQNAEVIVSRGELVEIGGSFRVSEIMRESGATLIEVGTTNKTHLYDYERALTEETAMIMKVHTSNFVVKGFTDSVHGTDLVKLAHQHHLPVFEDLGSGVLFDLRPYHIGDEPTVQEVLNEGVDLVSFSGDKLLGGPQAGIIAGKKEWISRLKKNQLMRSLRVDKFTLAALHATLKSYLDGERAKQEIPTLRMILDTEEHIKERAVQFIHSFKDERYTCKLVELESEVGGGTMPEVKLPSWGVALQSSIHQNTAAFSQALRQCSFPVIGRVYRDQLLLDFRTIDEDELSIVQKALRSLS